MGSCSTAVGRGTRSPKPLPLLTVTMNLGKRHSAAASFNPKAEFEHRFLDMSSQNGLVYSDFPPLCATEKSTTAGYDSAKQERGF